MREPQLLYPGQVLTGQTGYPYGKARNITVTGDGTGTPWEARALNDLWGFQQDMLDRAGLVPNGNEERVGTSQLGQAADILSRAAAHRVAVASHIAAPSIGSFSFINAIGHGIISGTEALLAVGGNGTTHRIQMTLDGDSWSGPTLGASTFGFNDVIYTTRWVAVGIGECAHSTDGVTWTFSVSGDFSFQARAVCLHGASRLVAVGEFSDIRTSDNHGSSWTLRTPAAADVNLLDVASNGSRLVAVGVALSPVGPAIWTSDNGGVTWTVRSPAAGTPSSAEFWSVHHFNGLWVIVGNAGRIQISRDGINWTAITAAEGYIGTFKTVNHTGALWVIGGETGEIQTSINGKVWTRAFDRGAVYEIRAFGVQPYAGYGSFAGNAALFRRTLMW